MKKMKKGSEVLWTMVVVVLVLLSSCNSSKPAQKNHRDYRYKTTQFDQKKYKIRKDFPPVQRYYNKNPLFRPRK